MTFFCRDQEIVCVRDELVVGEAYGPTLGDHYIVLKSTGEMPHPEWLRVQHAQTGKRSHFKPEHFALPVLAQTASMEAAAEEYEETMRGLDLVKINK